MFLFKSDIKKTLRTVAVVGYAIAAIVAYGHAYNHIEDYTYDWITLELKPRPPESRAYLSGLAALAWPAYLTTRFFDRPLIGDAECLKVKYKTKQ